ncbi:MAG: hypothetical protein AABX64_02925 [Nanoarchaeota archaeon]
MADCKNPEYKLELIVKDPMGFEGEMTLQGTTDQLDLAKAVELSLITTQYSGSLEVRLYRDGKPITSEQLHQDFARRYLK